jgi:hypothetical protein
MSPRAAEFLRKLGTTAKERREMKRTPGRFTKAMDHAFQIAREVEDAEQRKK